jgi:endonuclease/exonuclease/phosphatase family metal-dependent hydrolase
MDQPAFCLGYAPRMWDASPVAVDDVFGQNRHLSSSTDHRIGHTNLQYLFQCVDHAHHLYGTPHRIHRPPLLPALRDSVLCGISNHSGRIRFRGGGNQPGLAHRPVQLLDVPRGSRLSDMKLASTGVERGVRFDSIFALLRKFEADLILIQETDLNARRSAYRDVARELAQSLCLNYVFGLQFQELSSPKGMRPAYQGLAALSPWPLLNGRVIRFGRQSRFWLPRPYIPRAEIFQRRLRGRIALVWEVAIGSGRLAAYNVHLESRGTGRLRIEQVPSVIGGDFNLVASFTTQSVRGLPARGDQRRIDGLFVRDGTSEGRSVHTSVAGSDHFPVSARIY